MDLVVTNKNNGESFYFSNIKSFETSETAFYFVYKQNGKDVAPTFTFENFDYKFVVDAYKLSKEKIKSYKLEEEIDSLKLKIEALKSELKDKQKVIVRNKSNDEIICETTLEGNLIPPTHK